MLNPNLDLPGLATAYRAKQRLLIRDILLPDVAEHVWHCLMHETPWALTYNEGREVVHVMPEQLARMALRERMQLSAALEARAVQEFQFQYLTFKMVAEYVAGRHRDLAHMRVLEALNALPVLDFVRALSGIATINKADAQATLYAPRHFLTVHDDGDDRTKRRLAYVLNFSKGWNPDWGGLLRFHDEAQNVTDTFLPHFNSLAIFTVPQLHSVSYVTPFAPIGRLAITGWFQEPTPDDVVISS